MSMYPPRRKNPFIAGVLSFFVPGAGQLYNEDFGKAIVLFAALVASILTIVFTGISMGGDMMHEAQMPDPYSIIKIVASGLILFGIWLYSLIDAVISAPHCAVNLPATTPGPAAETKTKEGVIALGVVLVLFGIVSLLIQFGLKFEVLIKYGFPLALILLGGYLMARTSGLIKGGK